MEVKILSWNIWYKEDPEKIIRELERIDADIVCLQELTEYSDENPEINVPKLITERLSYDCKFFLAQAWEKDGKQIMNQGNGIFSKYGLATEKAYFIQDSSSLDPEVGEEGRVYGEVEILLNENTKITVATTHLSYTHKFEGSPKRDEENRQLLKAIGKNRKKYYFCGDLNALPSSPFIQSFAEKTSLIPALFYNDNTWTTKPFSYQGFEAKGLDYRLDYAFHSLDIDVLSSEVIQTEVSDHLPILTTIKI